MFRTISDAMASALNITLPSTSLPEDLMDINDMYAVEIEPSIALPVLSARHLNPKVLIIILKKVPVSESSFLDYKADKKKNTVKPIEKDEEVLDFIVPASTINLNRKALVQYKTLDPSMSSICNMYADGFMEMSAEHIFLNG